MRCQAMALVAVASTCSAPPPPSGPPPTAPARTTTPAVEEAFSPLEASIIASINRQRRSAGLAPLAAEGRLTRAARLHAANMASRNELSHTLSGTTTSTLVSRVADVGYVYRLIAENIAYGPVSVEPLVRGWMESPGHRVNILNGEYTETGVGVARSRGGVLFYCQVFGTPL